MNQDNFLRPSVDGEVDEVEEVQNQPAQNQSAPSAENQAASSEPVTAKSNRQTAPFEMEEQEAKLPEGVTESKRVNSGGMKRFVVAIFLVVLFIALIGALFIARSFRTQEQKVEVKNAPGARNSANEQEANSETQDAIQRAKEVAAQTAVSPTPVGQQTPVPGQPNLQNGSILNQPPAGAQQLVGTPIYDYRQATNSPQASPDQTAQNLSGARSSGGGSFSSGSGQNSRMPDESRETPAASSVAQNQPTKIEVPTANGGRTLYFLARSETAGSINNSPAKFIAPVYKPPFGSVLPVRVLGALHTLQSGGLARMELTRTVEGNNWRLPRGTIFVGRISGGADKRLFVSLVGYIEPRSNSLIELSGDVLGRDGAIGLDGEKKQLASRWRRIFGDAITKATQLGSAYLLGRNGGSGSVINTGSFEFIAQQANPYSQNGQIPTFVVVSAGANGYIMVNNLPPVKEIPTAPSKSDSEGDVLQGIPVIPPAGQVGDEELLRILTNGSNDEIRRAMPRMTPEWQNIARQTLEMRGDALVGK